MVKTVFSDYYPVCITLTGNQSASSFLLTNPEISERRFFNSHGYRTFLEQICEVDWLTLINSKDANEAFTFFGNALECVTTRLMADFACIPSVPLAAVFNSPVTSGVFPMGLKEASILPLFKGKGVKSDSGKYRPISLLSFVSKVFEKLVKRQLESYLEGISFFSSNQFGFRGALSTKLALSHIRHEVISTGT